MISCQYLITNMANSKQLFMIILFLFSSPLLVNSSNSITPPPKNNTTQHNEAICNSTPYPSDCISNLPRHHQSGTVRDFCSLFLHKSLSTTKHFLSLLNSYLKRHRPGHPTLSEPTIRALEDCHLLAELSFEALSKTFQTLNYTDALNNFETEEFQTLLSSVLTNTETCLEGLEETINSPSAINKVLSVPLSLGTKLYSISLALFKHGWVDVDYGNGDYNTNNGSAAAAMFGGRRKLLQAGLGRVRVSNRVVVNKNGRGNFTTISDAVAAAPNNTAIRNITSYFVIYVARGVYEEYVSIPSNKQNVMLIGDGINQTVITGNRSVVDGWTTYNSATFAVVGQGFVAMNITFRNTAGAIKHQAVAVRNGADLSAFYSCSFEGYQDTLYAHSLRQFYRDCDIYGTIDFIFGNAAVLFQNCNLYPRLPLRNQFNAITAQGRTDPNQNTGTSIQNCVIRAAPDLVRAIGTTRTFLGRPWKEYSRTVYMQSYMDRVVDPAGWREWSGNFSLSTLYYAEFNNSGPGSNTSNRVTWPGYHVINAATQVANFTLSSFILGQSWLPTTGVPYTNGLL